MSKKKDLVLVSPDVDLKSFEVTDERAFVTVQFGDNEYKLDVGSLSSREMSAMNDAMEGRAVGDDTFALRLVLQRVDWA